MKGFDFPLKAKLELIFLTLSVIMVTGKLRNVIIAVILYQFNDCILKVIPLALSAFHRELAVDLLDWGRADFAPAFIL